MDTLISCECYQGTCQVSSVFALLIIAHSSRNWSCVWIISALGGSWAHTHTFILTQALGANTPGVPASPRPVIANYCLQACGFGFRDCQLCITQPVFRDWVKSFSMSYHGPASSLFIITTLSFWVVKYWFCLSLCGSRSHDVTQRLLCRDVCAHFERRRLNF